MSDQNVSLNKTRTVIFISIMALTTSLIYTVGTETPRIFVNSGKTLHVIESLVLGFLVGLLGYSVAFFLLRKEHLPV